MGNTNNKPNKLKDDEKKKGLSTNTIINIVLGVLLAISVIIIIILIATRPKKVVCPTAAELCYISKDDFKKLGDAKNYMNAMGKRSTNLMNASVVTPPTCPSGSCPTQVKIPRMKPAEFSPNFK